ncbi:hypothetical protein HDU91_006477 [Kappamyces sp. JEL0680]|nr:hypothetical protein HDU91_006477 [Kappamyces sp. JEL0680]
MDTPTQPPSAGRRSKPLETSGPSAYDRTDRKICKVIPRNRSLSKRKKSHKDANIVSTPANGSPLLTLGQKRKVVADSMETAGLCKAGKAVINPFAAETTRQAIDAIIERHSLEGRRAVQQYLCSLGGGEPFLPTISHANDPRGVSDARKGPPDSQLNWDQLPSSPVSSVAPYSLPTSFF